MARPKNSVDANQPPTEREPAPATFTPPAYTPPPKRVHVERESSKSQPMAVKWPDIRGGTCEKCGVLDGNVEAKYQYKLCPHYRGLEARCTYCPESKDPEDVVYHETLRVMEYPPGSGTLIMWCGSFNCSQAHLKRFNRAA